MVKKFFTCECKKKKETSNVECLRQNQVSFFFFRLSCPSILLPLFDHSPYHIQTMQVVVHFGRHVKRFKRGDSVFGICKYGALTQFAIGIRNGRHRFRGGALTQFAVEKPNGIDFGQAAGFGIAALTAFHVWWCLVALFSRLQRFCLP